MYKLRQVVVKMESVDAKFERVKEVVELRYIGRNIYVHVSAFN